MTNTLNLAAIYRQLGGAESIGMRDMTNLIVKPVLGDEFAATTGWDDRKEYEALRLVVNEKYGYGCVQNGWTRLYRSVTGQVEAFLSPDGKVVSASVLHNCGIHGAFFVQAEK